RGVPAGCDSARATTTGTTVMSWRGRHCARDAHARRPTNPPKITSGSRDREMIRRGGAPIEGWTGRRSTGRCVRSGVVCDVLCDIGSSRSIFDKDLVAQNRQIAGVVALGPTAHDDRRQLLDPEHPARIAADDVSAGVDNFDERLVCGEIGTTA